MLELAPKCRSQTVEALDERQRRIITLPCEPGEGVVEQPEPLVRVA